MLKSALKFTFVLLTFQLTAQTTQDTFINVSGKIVSAKDSSTVSANILYEKLPYYDDMGMTASKGDDGFGMQLIQGNTYNITINKSGFRPFTQEIEITGEASQEEIFYLEVDEIELIKLENLTFATGSARITSASYTELNELADWMKENESVIVQLEGHTDFRGNAQAQVALSQARVDAVKEYLESQKVKKNRILTKAFGGTQPLSREDTAEARALNRRVEVRVIRR